MPDPKLQALVAVPSPCYGRTVRLQAWAALLFLVLAGCASSSTIAANTAWDEAYLEAAKERDRGNLDAAREGLLSIEPSAPDSTRARRLRFELAAITRDSGAIDDAIAQFEAIAADPARDTTGSRALHEAGRLTLTHRKDPAAALVLFERTIRDYPAHVGADFALQSLRAHYLAQGQARPLVALFESLAGEIDDAPMATRLLLACARVIVEELGDDFGGLAAYRLTIRRCAGCALEDDALWEMAQIYIRHQSWQPAIEILTRLADRTETSWFVGTYNSPWAGSSRLELGLIYMLFLQDYDSALREFGRFIDEFPHSFHTDDAAWHMVEIARLSGDQAAYHRRLREFARDFPDSRYVRQADKRLARMQP